MDCPRCGHANRGASWYCANCGAPVADLNVADSVAPPQLPALVRWSLLISAGALVMVALMAVALVAMGGYSRPGGKENPQETTALADGATGDGTGVVAPGTVDGERSGAGSGEQSAGSADSQAGTNGTGRTGSGSSGTAGVSGPGGTTGAAASGATAAGPGGAGGGGSEGQAGAAGPDGTPAAGSPGGGANQTPLTRPGSPVWRIPRVGSPPVLDGMLDDWRSDPIDITAAVFGDEYWEGPTDLSAKAFGGWDDENLYLGVRVVDDVFSQPSRGEELYLGDSLEVQLDTQLEEDWDTDSYSADDWQIGLSPGDFAGQGPEAHIWRPADHPAAGIRLSARLLDDGYILEAAIPWTAIDVDANRVRSVGLALNVSDNDVAAPAQLTMISSSPARSWADPRSFGTLVLERNSAQRSR